MSAIFVIDTGYLLEFYQVPGSSNVERKVPVINHLDGLKNTGAMFFITIPCLVEVANHLADAPNGQTARTIADSLLTEIRLSIAQKGAWRIIPSAEGLAHFAESFSRFTEELLVSHVGLCDTFTITEAERLKSEYGAFGYTVHILTFDNQLKAREPDPEPNPYLG